MKTYQKIFLALFILGIILLITGLILTGFDRKNLNSGGAYESRIYQPDGKVTSVRIEAENASVHLQKTETGAPARAEYEENKNYKFNVNFSDGELSVVAIHTKWYQNWFNFNIYTPQITVYLDGDSFENVRLVSENGSVSSEIAFEAKSVYAKSNNGKISLGNATVSGDATLTTDNGSVNVENVHCGGKLYAETDNGNVYVNRISASEVFLETDNGKIQLENVVCTGKVRAETNNRGVYAENVTANEIFLETDNGSVKGFKLTADNISMNTDNGSIEGSVSGVLTDYAISSKTYNGNSNLPNGTQGSKRLTVKTHNGNINVSFFG